MVYLIRSRPALYNAVKGKRTDGLSPRNAVPVLQTLFDRDMWNVACGDMADASPCGASLAMGTQKAKHVPGTGGLCVQMMFRTLAVVVPGTLLSKIATSNLSFAGKCGAAMGPMVEQYGVETPPGYNLKDRGHPFSTVSQRVVGAAMMHVLGVNRQRVVEQLPKQDNGTVQGHTVESGGELRANRKASRRRWWWLTGVGTGSESSESETPGWRAREREDQNDIAAVVLTALELPEYIRSQDQSGALGLNRKKAKGTCRPSKRNKKNKNNNNAQNTEREGNERRTKTNWQCYLEFRKKSIRDNYTDYRAFQAKCSDEWQKKTRTEKGQFTEATMRASQVRNDSGREGGGSEELGNKKKEEEEDKKKETSHELLEESTEEEEVGLTEVEEEESTDEEEEEWVPP